MDRTQTTLLPHCVDDYVGQDNPVRATDAFVDMLDLGALGIDVEPEVTGRPGYHPATMRKIYVYVYVYGYVLRRGRAREGHESFEPSTQWATIE